MSVAGGPNALSRFPIGPYRATGRVTTALAAFDGSGSVGSTLIEVARGAAKATFPGRVHEVTLIWAVATVTGTAAGFIKLFESLDAGVTIRPLASIATPAHGGGAAPPVGGPPDVVPLTGQAPVYWRATDPAVGRRLWLTDEDHRIYAATHLTETWDVHSLGLVY